MRAGRILLLGADGFIGRHLAFAFRAEGYAVLASARRVSRLAEMGFETLQADLENPETHKASFWRKPLGECDFVVNAAGLLQGSDRRFEAVHLKAPAALYAALPAHVGALLISAIGIDDSATPFARYRREAEAQAARHGVTLLRPGLVLGQGAYGGSALLRALAVMPVAVPIVGGQARINPIHASDLARVVLACLHAPPGPEPHELGGPETLNQTQILSALRGWFGLAPARFWHLPGWMASGLAWIGDRLRLGPISSTALAQLSAGIEARNTGWLAQLPPRARPRPFAEFLAAHPPSTGDLWYARFYLLRPLLRLVLIALWLVSGLLGLLLPAESFLPLISSAALPDTALIAMARLGGLADLMIALALARAWRLRLMGWLQFGLIAGYTLAFTLLAPGLWALPLGGLLKNPALLVLILVFLQLEEER